MFDDRLTRLQQERDAAIARAERADARDTDEPTAEALRDDPVLERLTPAQAARLAASYGRTEVLPTVQDVLDCAKSWEWQPGEEVIQGAAEFLQALGLVAPDEAAEPEAPVSRAEVEFTLIPCPQCAQGEERDGEWRSICSRHQSMTTATRETVRIAEISAERKWKQQSEQVEAIAREVVAEALGQLLLICPDNGDTEPRPNPGYMPLLEDAVRQRQQRWYGEWAHSVLPASCYQRLTHHGPKPCGHPDPPIGCLRALAASREAEEVKDGE